MGRFALSFPPVHVIRGLLACSAMAAIGGCAHPSEVSPAEIPDLAARAAKEPQNPALLTRFAAALFSGGQCDSATAVANRSLAMQADQPVAVLVAGQCDEQHERIDAAVSRYRQFLTDHADSRGAPAIRARQMLAFREQATAHARAALQQEQQLAQQPGDPQTLAVLPLDIQGDSSYQPLSRGLAQIFTSDLALLQRFRMVERVQLNALLDEMHLGQSNRMDQGTAARVGHLVQAGRMVQGLAAIPSDQNVRLEVSVLRGTGEVSNPAVETGTLRDLLKMEKDAVVGVAAQLGYQLSEAERRMILENGTQDLAAFLSYSRGLIAEDAGDFSRAAAYFSQAVQRDPGFQQARTSYQASAAAPGMQAASAGQVTTSVAQASTDVQPTLTDATEGAVNSSVGDLASTSSEKNSNTSSQVTQQASSTAASSPPPPPVTPPATVTGTIRIVFRLP